MSAWWLLLAPFVIAVLFVLWRRPIGVVPCGKCGANLVPMTLVYDERDKARCPLCDHSVLP